MSPRQEYWHEQHCTDLPPAETEQPDYEPGAVSKAAVAVGCLVAAAILWGIAGLLNLTH